MNFRHLSEEEETEVNLTPLIDVVFLLLIFFMATTTFDQNAELEVDLPTASTTEVSEKPESIELLIDSEGRYYVNGQEVLNSKPEMLFQAMSQVVDEMGGSPPVIISGDANVDYQSVITAMDIAGRLGLTKVSMATSQSKK